MVLGVEAAGVWRDPAEEAVSVDSCAMSAPGLQVMADTPVRPGGAPANPPPQPKQPDAARLRAILRDAPVEHHGVERPHLLGLAQRAPLLFTLREIKRTLQINKISEANLVKNIKRNIFILCVANNTRTGRV